MFQLDDSFRRLVCRALFVVCCALPTVAVASWAVALRLPGHVEAVEERLSRELGAAVQLGELVNCRPGTTRWQQVELSDLELHRSLASLATIELDRHAEPATLTIDGARLTREGVTWLWELAADVLRRSSVAQSGTLHVIVRQALLVDGEQPTPLGDLVGQFEFHPAGSQLTLRFAGDERSPTDGLFVRLVRNRQTSPATSGVELRTGATPLPCSWLAWWLDELDVVGSGASFHGQLWAVGNDTQWEIELTGQLLGVDLDRLITQRYPHRLHGLADVALERARWKDGRMLAAAGVIEAQSGTASRSLILAASDGLRWRVRRSLREGEPTDLIPFQRLSIGFALDEAGLLTEGRCGGSLDGILAQDELGPLLAHPEPGAERVPAANLIRTLAPSQEPGVPANRQAQALWQLLPAPQQAERQVARQTGP